MTITTESEPTNAGGTSAADVRPTATADADPRRGPDPAPTGIDVPRGLKGVVVTETGIGDVRGREGFYHYRQNA